MGPGTRALALAAAALALTLPVASAQCAAPSVTLEDAFLALEPGEATYVRVGLDHTGERPVRASVAVSAPPGWSAVPMNPEPVLEGDAPTVTAITVIAPERGAGVTEGDVVVRVEVPCADGVGAAASEARVHVSVTPLSTALVAVLAALGVAGVGGLVAARFVSRLAGVGVAAPERERDVAPGGTANFRLTVENRRAVAERVVLAVGVPPEGWSVVAPVPELALEPREAKEVWVALKAPPEAAPGASAEVVVHAALREDPRRAAAVLLRAKVP